MSDCFISYSSVDERFAEAVYHDLTAHGLTVFMAKTSLQPGDRSREKWGRLLKFSRRRSPISPLAVGHFTMRAEPRGMSENAG